MNDWPYRGDKINYFPTVTDSKNVFNEKINYRYGDLISIESLRLQLNTLSIKDSKYRVPFSEGRTLEYINHLSTKESKASRRFDEQIGLTAIKMFRFEIDRKMKYTERNV